MDPKPHQRTGPPRKLPLSLHQEAVFWTGKLPVQFWLQSHIALGTIRKPLQLNQEATVGLAGSRTKQPLLWNQLLKLGSHHYNPCQQSECPGPLLSPYLTQLKSHWTHWTSQNLIISRTLTIGMFWKYINFMPFEI